MTSLGDLPGRRSCTEEAQVPLAPRRKLGLAPGQLAARGAAPAVSQYETIDSDAIFGVRGAVSDIVRRIRPAELPNPQGYVRAGVYHPIT